MGIVGLCMLLTASAARAQTAVENHVGEYRTWRLPAGPYHPWLVGRPHWLDEDRLIFTVRRPETTPSPGSDGYESRRTVAVWDTRTNKVALHMPGRPLCVNAADGYVVIEASEFRLPPNAPLELLKGVWGEPLERDTVLREDNRVQTPFYINPVSCRVHEGRGDRLLPNHLTVPLREDHGFLDEGELPVRRDKKDQQLVFVRPTGDQTVIPFIYDELWSDKTRYYRFADTYLLKGPSMRANDHEPKDRRSIRLLRPSGEVERIYIPEFFWARARSSGAGSHLTRVGLLWTFGTFSSLQGTYLAQGGALKKILDEEQGEIEVSPSGCRIAYLNASGKPFSAFHNPLHTTNIHVTDLCQGDKK